MSEDLDGQKQDFWEDTVDEVFFAILFQSAEGERLARTVIESLRTFGGPLSNGQVWAFSPDDVLLRHSLSNLQGIQRVPLAVEAACAGYPFAEKVAAYARAEELAGPEVRSLVWLSLDCLIANPPVLFDLGESSDAAFRPVHHRNIGSPAGEHPDGFWSALYQALGIDEIPYTVESFVESQSLRPYLNTHCFALNPARGLGRAWWESFQALVTDRAFQAGPCRDDLHRIFLHQAILSTLVAKLLERKRVRLLPPQYNYPLNLHTQVPTPLRPRTLNELVSAVYEDAFPWAQIEVEEPLRSWLLARLPSGER
jgi:hypothetical protein